MINKNIYKKISGLLIFILILNLLVFTNKANAQVIDLSVFGSIEDPRFFNVDDIGNVSFAEATADCIQDAIFESLLGAAGDVITGYLEDIAGDFLGSFLGGEGIGDLMSGGGLGGLIGGGTVPVNDDAVKKTTQNISKINTAMKSDLGKQTAKEFGDGKASLDSIAFCLANKTIEGIVKETAKWVNNGFGGNPIYVKHPEQYFGDIRDFKVKELLDELICVDVNINNVKERLVREYYAKFSLEIPECPLGTIEVDFVKGDFSQGGWNSWLEYTQRPENNNFGYEILLQGQLERRIDSSEKAAKLEFQANNGYLSAKDAGGNITTPGNMFESQVKNTLNAPLNRLTTADEFDEILNNLINNYLNISIGGLPTP